MSLGYLSLSDSLESGEIDKIFKIGTGAVIESVSDGFQSFRFDRMVFGLQMYLENSES